MAEFPSDIIANVLSRLPTKPLFRFKCVSKSWKSLINSPNFTKLHLFQTLTSSSHRHLLICQATLASTLTPADLNFSPLDHPLSHLPDPRGIEFLGSCNGILFITDYPRNNIALFNPSTKSTLVLPPFFPSPKTNPVYSGSNPDAFNLVLFGLGYDSLSQDYKVLRMIDTHNKTSVIYHEAAVYSLSSGSWKCIPDPTKLDVIHATEGGIFVPGSDTLNYVVCGSKRAGTRNQLIKCFHLRDDSFSTLELPKYEGKASDVIMFMAELGGSLCVMLNYLCPNRKLSQGFTMLSARRLVGAEFWVMKEYGKEESWVKVFTFHKLKNMPKLTGIRPVAYSSDGQRVLLELNQLWFCWYDLKKNKLIRNCDPSGVPSLGPFKTYSYVDTLVSPANLKQPNTHNLSKSDILAAELKVRPSNQTEDAAKACNIRDDILSQEFKLRLSGKTTDATDLCNA